jgi:D-alanine-D-alanine ligase
MSSVFSIPAHLSLDKKLKVWVLAPYLQTNDANLDYYYDFSQSIAEYTKAFNELDMEWVWQPVTMENFSSVIQDIIHEKEEGEYLPVVFNICDGDEINGTPGISVVKMLQESGLVFTGSNDHFYDITTSKIPMKEAFDKAGVSNAAWEIIYENDPAPNGIFERLGSPIIVKPAISGGSMGVGIRNVVHTEKELKEQVAKMYEGYRGWQLAAGGIIAEQFITGPEYTTLIVGSSDKPNKAIVYNPVERVFHESLPETEKFLSFDRLWETYEEESPMPDQENFYEYHLPDASLTDAIKKLSWHAYVATGGKGYTRVDIRQDKNTGELYVLEVNAQCGLSEDEDFTSIGAILRLSGKTFTQLVVEIINDAFARTRKKYLVTPKKKTVKVKAGF